MRKIEVTVKREKKFRREGKGREGKGSKKGRQKTKERKLNRLG
jgi:hypothetical protein